MPFNTSQYGFFFILVFAIHWMLPRRYRRPFLLVASYYFYASALPQYLLLILGLTAFNYALGLGIGRARQPWRTRLMWVGVAGNILSLGYFKYTGLALSTISPVLHHLPLLGAFFTGSVVVNIIIPLGISFFTFEFIHYVVEVERGMPAMRNTVDFALFSAFFPTQIAGPIKRFPDFAKQLLRPIPFAEVEIDAGVGLILRGLVKKIVFADMLAPAVATLFAHPERLGPVPAWFAVFAFAAQIYGDFSGYTDIGRGCATLLGYSVPENFLSPYQSASPNQFWYRWHVTLSNWLRDYLYFSLGGSRVPRWRIYLNLMITMALGGLWHGADWHFVAWGIYQGLLLWVNRYWEETVGKTARYAQWVRGWVYQLAARVVTLVLVCIGWIFFRADSVGAAFQMLGSMFAFNRPLMRGWTFAPLSTPVLLMGIAALVVLSGWAWALLREPALRWWRARDGLPALVWLQRVVLFGGRPAVYSLAVLVLLLWPPHIAHRFIYFQF